MLNFPKSQCHALSHTERLENAPPVDDETTTMNKRLMPGPRLKSPEQYPTGTPLSAPVKPVVTVPDPAPTSILPVTPPSTSLSLPITSSLPVWRQPGHAHPVAFVRGEPSETDRRLQDIAKQVSNARQPVLEEMKDAIRDAKLHSLPVVLEWLQFCANALFALRRTRGQGRAVAVSRASPASHLHLTVCQRSCPLQHGKSFLACHKYSCRLHTHYPARQGQQMAERAIKQFGSTGKNCDNHKAGT